MPFEEEAASPGTVPRTVNKRRGGGEKVMSRLWRVFRRGRDRRSGPKQTGRLIFIVIVSSIGTERNEEKTRGRG